MDGADQHRIFSFRHGAYPASNLCNFPGPLPRPLVHHGLVAAPGKELWQPYNQSLFVATLLRIGGKSHFNGDKRAEKDGGQ